jgi:hypothetical protein
MIGKQPIQRRCDKCIRAVLQNNGNYCSLYCTMKRETVSKFDQCSKFFYGKLDKRWVK